MHQCLFPGCHPYITKNTKRSAHKLRFWVFSLEIHLAFRVPTHRLWVLVICSRWDQKIAQRLRAVPPVFRQRKWWTGPSKTLCESAILPNVVQQCQKSSKWHSQTHVMLLFSPKSCSKASQALNMTFENIVWSCNPQTYRSLVSQILNMIFKKHRPFAIVKHIVQRYRICWERDFQQQMQNVWCSEVWTLTGERCPPVRSHRNSTTWPPTTWPPPTIENLEKGPLPL